LATKEFEQAGIVLSSIGARCGKCFLAEGEWTSLANTQLIFPDAKEADIRFLWYQLDDEARWPRSGAAQPFVRPSDVKSHTVYLPPLEEQRRIVAVLEEAFAAIATATANAQKNLANARDLFASGVPRIMAAGADTTAGALGEIGGRVYTGPFGSLLHKRDYVPGGIPLVNPSHIDNGKILPSDEKCVSFETAERLSSYRMKVGDIVFGRRGEMGRCAVVTDNEGGFLCGTGSFFIRPLGQTDPHYLAHLLRSEAYRRKFESLASGATMPNLSNTALSDLEVELPAYSVQQELVLRVDVLEAEVGSVSARIHRKIAELTALKQSLLHRAFSGELTEREPLAA
jgi:type I restriction enzyme S subunit